jgi:peptide/nickel transport system substrate-binding protein
MDNRSDRGTTPIGRRALLLGGLGVGGAALLGRSQLVAAANSGARARGLTASRPRTVAPRRGGQLRVGVTDTVPPTYAAGFSGGAQGASYQTFAWPVFHGAASDDVEPTPGLCDGYVASEDGLVHTFDVRAGMTFHDGSPITAEAVAECLRSMAFPDHPLRDEGTYNYHYAGFGNPTIIESIDVVDDGTFEIHLSQPRAEIRQGLTQHYIYNPAIMSQPEYGTDVGALRDIGSGPFRVTNFEPAAFLETERYEEFVDEVLLDALRFENFADSAAMSLALRGGEIDAAFAVRKADHEELAADPNFQPVIYEPSFNVFFIMYAPNNPALQDPRVREAVGLAMNRPAYREAFFSADTAAASSQGVLHPERRGYNPDIVEPPYDPERARQLLSEAGVDGFTMTLTAYPSGSHVPEAQSMAEAMVADLNEVGIEVELTISDYATYLGSRYDFDAWFNAYAPESSSFVETLICTPPAQVGEAWPETDPRSDPRVPELLAAGVGAFQPEVQAAAFEELQAYLHDESRLIIPIAQISSSIIARQGVHDFKVATLAPGYEKAWIEE